MGTPLSTMKALDFLKYVKDKAHITFHSPRGREASNTELRDWLNQGAFTINGTKPKWDEEIEFPVSQFVFAYGKKTQITILGDSEWPK